jgi:SAM-dependent methyltransferase
VEAALRREVRKVEVSIMASPYLSPYEDPAAHARISALIRHHSSNREDVRGAMLGSLDLGCVEEVLDLGCGFGFWTEEVADRVAPGAHFTGIDACDGNEHSYLRSVESTGRQARFIRADLDSHLSFEDASFDLVIAAYSLYFFVRIVPEVARVLRPCGQFLAVTHSERCFAGLLSAVELSDDDSPLLGLIRRFSAENGRSLLIRSFGRVKRVDYHNTLTFREEDRGDFLAYLQFKLPLLSPGAQYGKGLPEAVALRASESLRKRGRVTVRKDDALFVCGGPDGP